MSQILVIEDEQWVATRLEAGLAEIGFQVMLAFDGSKAFFNGTL